MSHLIILPFGVFSIIFLFFFMYLECDMPLLPLCMDYNRSEHSQGSQGRRRHRRGRPAAGAGLA